MKTGSPETAVALVCISLLVALTVTGCGGGTGEQESAEIHWLEDLDTALLTAREVRKPLMIDFTATWCPPCRKMEDSTFSNTEVIRKARSFVTLRIDVDKQRDIAVKYNGNARKYGGVGIPNILFMTAGEKRLRHIIGYYGPDRLVAVMDSVLTIALTDKGEG
ncbi:MAG: thioredoxin family protein [bacterium]|nr:MAG: thioredoxin family protein [bacterium]